MIPTTEFSDTKRRGEFYMAARIDLSRDLPKVRQQWDAVLKALETRSCEYPAPCIIGAMVSPRKRNFLESGGPDLDGTTAEGLLRVGMLKAPAEQHKDIIALQQAFDGGDVTQLEAALKRIEAKYAPVSA